MIASIVITIFVSSVSVFLMSSSIAESSPPTLARFVDGDQSLQKLIEFPDVDDNVLTIVYCLAHVQKNGEIVRNHCFPSETVDPSLPDAIDTAAKLARASPATVGNKLRSVRLYYRVVFIQNDGIIEVGVYSNWGADVDKYGLTYEAPQRYSDALFPQACSFLPIESARVTAVIATDGTVNGDVEIELGNTNTLNRCENSIRNAYKNFKYIPAHLEGQPVEATFVEVLLEN